MNKNEIDNKHFGLKIANCLTDAIIDAYAAADFAIEVAQIALDEAEEARLRIVDAAILSASSNYRNRGRLSCDAAELRYCVAIDRKIASEVLKAALAKRNDLGMGSVELVEIKSVNELF